MGDLVLETTIKGRDDGAPLLPYLAERFTYYSRERWLEGIGEGWVTVNAARVAAGHVLREGDRLTCVIRGVSEPAVDTSFAVILADRELILVDKPAGTPVTRSGLIVKNTLVNLVRRRFGSDDIHPLHRIDRETGGLVLFGRNKEVCRRFQSDLSSLIGGKYYLAVVRGAFPHERIRVDMPLGPRGDSEIRCRMWPGVGKPCRTVFYCLRRGGDRSLVLARLLTGRRHQIRAHLAHLGHPVVGDKIYAHGGRFFLKKLEQGLDEEDYRILGAKNHLLHAWSLTIARPGGKRRFFSEGVSAEFCRALEGMGGWRERALAVIGEDEKGAMPEDMAP